MNGNTTTQEAPAVPPGWGALLSGTNGIRSVALSGGVALHAINLYIVTTILPSVVRDIGGLDYYAWNTSLFVVASILGATLSSRVLRRLGPRGAYAAAAVVFGVGALACAGAVSMPMLLVGRVIQGLGGGMLLALPYAMIRMVFDASLWPRAMGLISSMWGVATLVGPAVGGIFAELDAWRWAFGALVPATLLFSMLAMAVLPGRAARTAPAAPLAWRQLGLLTGAVLAVSAGSVGTDAVWNVAGVVTALLLVLALIRTEARAPHRLLPTGTFRLSSPLGPLYATMTLLAVTVTCSEIFVPLFLQVLHRQPPLHAGYVAAVMSAGWTVGSIASSGLGFARVSSALRLAPWLGVAGMVILAVLVPRPSDGGLWHLGPICVAMFIVGNGVGLAWPHLASRVLHVAPAGQEDVTSSSITTVQLFSTAMGSALAGMVANLAGLVEPGGEAGVARAAQWLFALFAFAPALGVFTIARVLRLRAADRIEAG